MGDTRDDGAGRELLMRMAPSWDPDALGAALGNIMRMAPTAAPGTWLETVVPTPQGFGVIALDFDGARGVLVNPCTFQTQEGREFASALRVVLDGKAQVGEWKDGRPVLVEGAR
jgi:hypothetical protein